MPTVEATRTAKTAHGKAKKPKPEAPRGWHVANYLPSADGLTEDEARRLHAGLLHPGDLVEPEGGE